MRHSRFTHSSASSRDTQRPFQLPRLHRLQNFAEAGTRLESQRKQIIAAHQRRRNDRLVRKLLALPQEEFVVVHHRVTARAIDPMQLQLVLEGRPRHETFQLRHPHVRHILEDHVLPHRLDRGVDFRARKTQPLHERLRHFRADAIVPVEANAPVFVD